jgi:hypothetical protein
MLRLPNRIMVLRGYDIFTVGGMTWFVIDRVYGNWRRVSIILVPEILLRIARILPSRLMRKRLL